MTGRTIGNPVSWSAQKLAGMGRGVGHAIDGIGGHQIARPQVNRIELADLRMALREGARDFAALRSDVIFLVALYPVIGFILAVWVLNAGQVHLLFPLVAGFPLIGPAAAVGLYEMSRRREAGLPADWGAALSALGGRVLGPVLMLGLLLLVVFVLWLNTAHAIWSATLGPQTYDSLLVLLRDCLTTQAGREMLILGVATGFLFAVLVLSIGMISFPMLIDRPVGVPMALATSLAVARANPGATAAWGMIVCGALLLGMIPFFAGLIVVLPILGHATWHLYRRAVTFPDPAAG